MITEPKNIVKIIRIFIIFIIAFIIIFIAIKFGFHFLGVIPAFLLFLFRSYLFNILRGKIFNFFQSNQYKSSFNNTSNNNSSNTNNFSKIDTDTLSMTLNHATGEIDGYIKTGKFKGKNLDNLSIEDLLLLRKECLNSDKDALRLLEAYLDRTDFDWKRNTNDYDKNNNEENSPDSMTIKEAYQVLGLDDTANKEKIKQTYQSLISKLHPDKGGSDYLASKLNQAKDILINKK
ncbi:DnaJ domain-containing protein [Alphaproteobacteria bacterium]|nr:DnaJ domain-containing protein [Alphaproteobacteria bacterium]